MTYHRKLYAVAAVCAATALIAAACTSSKSVAVKTSSPASGSSSTSSGNAAPATIAIPRKTLGILEYVEASYVEKQVTDETVRAAKALGWKTIVKDGQGQPALLASSAQSFVQSKVDAFISVAVDPTLIQTALQQFKANGTPAVNVAGILSDPNHLYDAIYKPSSDVQGALAADYLNYRLKPGQTVVSQNLDSLLDVKLRAAAFKSVLDTFGTNKVVATHQIDVTNLVSDTISSVRDQITANQNVGAIFSSIDAQFGPICNLLNQRNQKDIAVLSTYTFPDSVKALKTCPNGAIMDAPSWWTGWMAVDQLLAFFTKNTPFNAVDEATKYPIPSVIVTQVNMPADRVTYPFPDLGKTIYAAWQAAGYKVNALADATVATS
jgi:ABC-type sugar transport system substrate-binding protein